MKPTSRRAWLQHAGAWASLRAAPGLAARSSGVPATALLSGAWLPQALRAQTAAAAAPTAMDWPELSLLDGSVLPPSAWQGTGAVLVFWATHCAFCRRHNQHVEKLHRALAGQPVRVLGLSSDKDAPVVRRHMQQQGLSFAVTLQSEMLRTRLGLRRTLPTTVTVDRSGRLGMAIPGEMFEDDVMGLARVASVT